MRTRLADIAQRAGVSEATASRVLNDRPGVAPDTRQSVLAAADVLGYARPTQKPRQAHRHGGALGLVGLIVPELTNPVFPIMVQVIENALVQEGFTPLLCTQSPGGVQEDDYIAMMTDHGVAGIVFVSGLHADTRADPQRYFDLVARRMPVVFLNGFLAGLDAPFMSCDDAVSARLAVHHLADLGHRRIGLACGPERYTPVIRKRDGYLRAMRDRFGVDAAELVTHTVFSVEGGSAAGLRLLDAGVTAVVCGSDLMALGVIRAGRGRGLAVPGDLSVIGYDDSPLVAFADPPLSTVRQPVEAMCVAAVRALLEEIRDVPAARTELVFQPELVVRGSTGPAPR
jgi:LacI family repressor for deo operon, udp, cdd, tsx, nupC, and nupG